MKHVALLVVVVLLVSVLSGAFLLRSYVWSDSILAEDPQPKFYVGVDIPYANLTAVENRINQVSSFANLIIIGCTNITYDPAKLSVVCQYIFDRDIYFQVYSEGPINQQWVAEAISKWGNHFLGLYVWDEPGGKQADLAHDEAILNSTDAFSPAPGQPVTNSDIEQRFEGILHMGITRSSQYGSVTLPIFTSDYALYWFDYKAGYDTLYAELGWNYSRAINVDCVRGAANVQNKTWGAMITWTYTQPPYIESGPQLYADMKYAYDSGAKYIVVFDSNANWTDGILQPEHLEAMQQFWNYMKSNPQNESSSVDRVAYVLPDAFAYGFRGFVNETVSVDKIWGLFPADNSTFLLCIDLNNAINQHGNNLDIIYDDAAFPNYAAAYRQLIFWNGTTLSR